MDYELASLKLKRFLFSFADIEKQQDQKQMPVEENQDESLIGPPTYASGLTIGRNN